MMDPEGPKSPVSSLKNFTIDQSGRVISFSRVREYEDDEDDEDEDDYDYDYSNSDNDFYGGTSPCMTTYDANDDERLASLEALRYALHHAPFCRNSHTLMSIPDECSMALQGIPTKCAIRVEGVCYSKGILDQVNLEVPKGKITALLGCAGSGKSTLLKCILGRLRPTSGTVTTFGTCPTTSPLSAICVGYMPQEVALHEELTVGQTLHHYGRLYQLPLYLIVERVAALCTMLHLPSQCALVKRLNPGQKWRISLAVALIHSPPLLLLDEPTVMVDPLIRWSVWNRLGRLCDEEGLTVLITTKYPEEIAFAYKVGLMRNGHIYAEDRPEELRQRYGCATYDQLYSRFCESNVPRRIRDSIAPYLGTTGDNKQYNQLYRNTTSSGNSYTTLARGPNSDGSGGGTAPRGGCASMFPIFDRLKCAQEPQMMDSRLETPKISQWPLPMAEWPICERRRTAYLTRFINLDWKRLFALVMKNLYIIRGNLLPIVIFYFMFPALQIVFMCAIFGRTVKHLPVTIPANLALRDNFGPTFVHSFLDQKIFAPAYSRDMDEALSQVKGGQAWAAIVPWTASSNTRGSVQQAQPSSHQPSNSSQPTNPCGASSQTPYGIALYLDQSNYVIAQTMFYSFISSMRAFLKSDTSGAIIGAIQRRANCSDGAQEDPVWSHSAIDIQEVIYGSTQFRFLEFLLPGFLCAYVFAYALVLTAYLFIKEHIAGLQERCLTTGTSGVEVLAAHYISQTCLYILQQTLILVIVFRLFGLPSRGPFYSLWLLIFLQGLTGIAFGLFIAVISPTPMCAAMMTSAIFMPAFFFSGIIWPIESMHRITQHLSHALPLTLPINSLRYIISRGPDMRYSQIVLGFSISTGYIAVLLLLTVAIFKCKTSS